MTRNNNIWGFTASPPCHLQSVQSLSHVRLFATPWTAAPQASLCHHQFLEFTQTHVHWDGDAIQPSHPLSSPSPALNLSQHQGLFKWVSSSHQVAKVLEFQLQHQSFQWIFWTDCLLGWTCWISLLLSLARRILSSPMLCPWSQDCTGPG